jgi:histone deacetylase 1/2
MRSGMEMSYLLMNVDDIILTCSSTMLLQSIITHLHSEFKLKDLGELHFFFGVNFWHTRIRFFLSQERYAEEILDSAAMSNCNDASMPIDNKPKLSSTKGSILANATHYRNITGALQYLTLTQPDISYAIGHICLHMHAPCDCHW